MNLKTLIIIVLFVSVQMYFSDGEEIQGKAQEVFTTPPSDQIERSSHHHHEAPNFQGFWKKKLIWKPRWMKTWQEKKIYVAVWKRMWGPAEINEWVPVPKPPPGWVKIERSNYVVKVPH